jgi:hypothetical protein
VSIVSLREFEIGAFELDLHAEDDLRELGYSKTEGIHIHITRRWYPSQFALLTGPCDRSVSQS